MGLLDRITALFRQQQNAPAVTTADVAGLRRGAEPLDFAASLQADSERRATVKTCREMYKKDPRAKGVIKSLARDMTRGGFTVSVKDNPTAERLAADLDKRLDLDGVLDDWVRLTLRDGDTFLELGVDGGQHIALATRKPPLQMHRNSDAADRFPDPARAYWLAPETWYGGSEPPADAEWFADWQIIHARWDHDAEERYGVPLFAAATSAYKRIKEGETDIAVRRKTRSGVKYNHKFPEGTTADQIEAYKEANQDNLADPTAAIADFFGTADIQVVAGEGGALEAIGDVMHHVRTWWLASPLPMSLLGYGQDLNRDVLDKQSEQYQRALESLTQWVEAQFVKPLLEREWLLAGILPDSLKYEIKWKTTELLTIATVTAAADAVAKLTAAGMPKLAAWEMVERFLPGVDLTQAKAEMQQAAEDAKAQFAGQSAQPPTKRDNPPTNEPPKPGQPEPPVTAQEAVILGEVVAEYQRAAAMFGRVLAEFNPNHDRATGQFASGGSGGRSWSSPARAQR